MIYKGHPNMACCKVDKSYWALIGYVISKQQPSHGVFYETVKIINVEIKEL